MSEAEERVRERLFEMRDEEYGNFQCKLIPTVNPETVIGVRTPMLRSLAKELAKTPLAEEFLSALPHKYYDENNLHGFIVEGIKDYGQAVARLEEFLPYIDNWATCDLISPKAFKKRPPELMGKIREWLASNRPFTVRFGIEMLMSLYLDEQFEAEYLDMVANLRSREYYVNMMIAWYFATALAKRYEDALPYIEGRRLDEWTHNKTIRKAIESYRLSDERKAHLRALAIK